MRRVKKGKNFRKLSQGILRSLISATESSSNLTIRMLKRVNCMLLIPCRRCDFATSTDLQKLSEILFNHLQIRFNEFYATLLCASDEMNILVEDLALLLRCCLVVIDSLGDDQEAQLQYGRILLLVLRMITPVELDHRKGGKFIEFQMARFNDGTAAFKFCRVSIPSSCFSFFLPMLEVFADELLMNIATRKRLMLFDSISDTDPLFSQNYSFASIACVLEIITSHFFISFFVLKSPHKHSTLLSLESALILLSNPLISSSPKPYLSHLISLTSDAIPNTQFTNSASHAYETSLNLFSSQISSLQIHDPSLSFSSYNSFDSFLLPSSKKFLPLLTSKPEKFRHFPAINSVGSSLEYLKNKLAVPILDNEKYISSFLTRIVSESSSKYEKMMKFIGEEDGLVLVSILKLIFSSILHFKKFNCLEKIRRVTRFSESSPCVLSYSNEPVTKAEPPSGSEFKCLLMHFARLLPLCYASKMESLVENCLLVMAILCHVVVTDDGDVHGLQSLASIRNNSALKIARNMHAKLIKVRSLVSEEDRKENESSERCKGDAYLRCVVGKSAEALPDYEELAEFIECEADKNYGSWLQDCRRFRAWKRQKNYWGARKRRGWQPYNRFKSNEV